MTDKIFLGIHHHVVCLDSKTGEELWRTKLSGFFSERFVNLFLDGDQLFAYAGSKAFCLDVKSGQVKWETKLDGLSGIAVFASTNGSGDIAAIEVLRRQSAEASHNAAT